MHIGVGSSCETLNFKHVSGRDLSRLFASRQIPEHAMINARLKVYTCILVERNVYAFDFFLAIFILLTATTFEESICTESGYREVRNFWL